MKISNEPLLGLGGLAALVVLLAAHFGVVLDISTVQAVIAAALPLLVGLIGRFFVIPVAKTPAPVPPAPVPPVV